MHAHEMSIEANDCNPHSSFVPSKRPSKTLSFNQYSNRIPINNDDLKHNRPNENRFKVIDFLPQQKTGTPRMMNISLSKGTDRVLNFETLSITQDTFSKKGKDIEFIDSPQRQNYLIKSTFQKNNDNSSPENFKKSLMDNSFVSSI